MVIIDIIQVNSSSSKSSIKINLLDVRQEAVKQALEQFGARPIPSSKRIINPQIKRTNIQFFFFLK
jgi:hypothetical protein